MSNKNESAEFLLKQGITTLLCNFPFFAFIAMKLKKIEAHGIMEPDGSITHLPTMATDGVHLFYNPDFAKSLTPREMVGILAHEVAHVAGLHPWRRGPRDPFQWNIACDKVVNHIVTKAAGDDGGAKDMALPSGTVPPVGGKSAEELYEPPKGGKQKQKKKIGGSGAGTQPGQGKPEPGGDDPFGCGGVIDPRNADGSALSDAELDQQMNEARVMVREALNQAKQYAQGTVPAGLEQFVEEALEPRVPWREVLAQFVGGFTRNDYNWMQPNRRHLMNDLILPSLKTPGIGRGVIAPDLSGSMMGIIQEVVSEVRGCLAIYEERGDMPEIDVLWFDADVYPQSVTDETELKPRGGGGTSYVPVFNWVRDKADSEICFVVVITDGICDSFGPEPEVPTLWILTEENPHFKPPYGQVTCIMRD